MRIILVIDFKDKFDPKLVKPEYVYIYIKGTCKANIRPSLL